MVLPNKIFCLVLIVLFIFSQQIMVIIAFNLSYWSYFSAYWRIMSICFFEWKSEMKYFFCKSLSCSESLQQHQLCIYLSLKIFWEPRIALTWGPSEAKYYYHIFVPLSCCFFQIAFEFYPNYKNQLFILICMDKFR